MNNKPEKKHLTPSGLETIKQHLKRLSYSPGVYRMIGRDGNVLYVGKAKNLKKRVTSYTQLGRHSQRIARMISLTHSMVFVHTETETEALLLEANLIKHLKPRYNILMRDDKSFPYILIRRDHPSPQIRRHRGTKSIKGEYFGPFASTGAVRHTLDTLQKAFMLRTCEDSDYETRTRPCMLYQIRRCAAPCVGLISSEGYNALVDQASQFLKGKAVHLNKLLIKEMEAAAKSLEYERAGVLRDRIKALSAIRASQGINPKTVVEADVFGLARAGGRSCVQVVFFRSNQHWGDQVFFPKHDEDASPEDILSAFITQFYDNRPAPKHILTSVPLIQAGLIAEALGQRAGYKIGISTPQKGEKRELTHYAQINADQTLQRKLAETASQAQLLKALAKQLEMDTPPDRIEIYDNSHIQGSHALGAMVVAGSEGFAKKQYRKFNIKSEDLTPGDDYAMMVEVMRRRFGRLLKEGRPKPAWPDLVIIDGGAGQLSSVKAVFDELGLFEKGVYLLAIAKGVQRNAGREMFFRPHGAPFQLPVNSPVLHYMQRLRDEAHRYAIDGHRAKRAADIRKNPLDGIIGIGATRKRALLNQFGSAKAVSSAKLSDLEQVEGINTVIAQRIYDYFHES